METTDNTNNHVNWFLALMTAIFKLCSTVSASDIGNFIFWSLSVFSITLMIIINYPKAKAALKGKQTEKE